MGSFSSLNNQYFDQTFIKKNPTDSRRQGFQVLARDIARRVDQNL